MGAPEASAMAPVRMAACPEDILRTVLRRFIWKPKRWA